MIFRPLEKLQIQKIRSVVIEEIDINDKLDTEYKPGLYLQLKAFLENDLTNFITIQEQADRMELFHTITNGGEFKKK